MAINIKDRLLETGRVTLVSLAQVAFTNTPLQGSLVLLAIALISPWSAVGAGFSALLSALVGLRFGQTIEEHSSGLGGYDTAILGILWGGALAQGEATALLFPLALLGCLALQSFFKRLILRMSLPPLALTGLVTAWLSHGVFQAFDSNFWIHPGALPFGAWGVWLAVGLTASAVFLRSWQGALLCGGLTAVSALASGWAYGAADFIGPAGFWAFAIAPASFALAGAYLPESKLGLKAGVFAALIAAVVWWVWSISPLEVILPPLLAPIFIGVWAALWIVLKEHRAAILDPALMEVVSLLRRNHQHNGKVTVLTGAGISTESGIPDYTSGAWLPPGIPISDYSFANFQVSDRCRNLYWLACSHFHDVVSQARPNQGHRALATLQECGWINAIVTQNVDGLHQEADSRQVIELHGTIHHVRCLSCAWTGEWPTPAAAMDCPQCGGMVKPAVVAMGEDLTPHIWADAWAQLKDSSVVLVVGSQLAITTTASLVAEARRNNAKCIFLTMGEVGVPIFEGDVYLPLNADTVLPIIVNLLDNTPSSFEHKPSTP